MTARPRSAAWLGALALALSCCVGHQTTVAPTATPAGGEPAPPMLDAGSTSGIADANVTVDAPPEAAPPPREEATASAWTDRVMVERLARDCEYVPAPDETVVPDELACEFEMERQSCTAGTCGDRVYNPCRVECAGACSRCDVGCRARCAQCRGACTDDACRARCATGCAGCLHACRETKDHCYTAICAQRGARCHANEQRQFARRCAAPCRRCTEQCGRTHPDGVGACTWRCAVRSGCTRDQAGICSFAGPNWATEEN